MDAIETFWHLHRGLPRQGPGSDPTTRRLLSLADPLPATGEALDLGCGPGRASLVLARETGLHITAVDTSPELLAELERDAAEQGLTDRITARQVSMDALDVAPGSVDLIWSEGAVYLMGFDAALRGWLPLLRDGGTLVLTECEWVTESPSMEAQAFWAEYPGMRTTAENVRAIESRGVTLRATYQLPDSDWWDEYYTPLEARIRAFAPASDEERAVAAAELHEIEVRRRCAEEYAYTGYVITKG
jgi:SAM-dependent methyltransferase